MSGKDKENNVKNVELEMDKPEGKSLIRMIMSKERKQLKKS